MENVALNPAGYAPRHGRTSVSRRTVMNLSERVNNLEKEIEKLKAMLQESAKPKRARAIKKGATDA